MPQTTADLVVDAFQSTTVPSTAIPTIGVLWYVPAPFPLETNECLVDSAPPSPRPMLPLAPTGRVLGVMGQILCNVPASFLPDFFPPTSALWYFGQPF